MTKMRTTTPSERETLIQQGCFAECWDQISVADSFSPSQLYMCRFEGSVMIHHNAKIYNSTVANYSIGEDCVIDSVKSLRCSGVSSFGNGIEVATLNECGGRNVKIYADMSSQVAYIATIYRNRPLLIERINSMVERYAEQQSSSMGEIGKGSKIIGAGIIRNVRVGCNVTIEGASKIIEGTILDGAYIGSDVKAEEFITIENSRIDNGATIERCFVGENVIISNGFTAIDSLFFASSHCENGEAASIFAGPYTVSHHKSSLLIAGMFSFFNAGSGSNQSNHLFRCGPVHQGIHLRGCKFGSGAYVMLPAIDGAYTSVIGSHSMHHDTSDFPFSYLLEKDGRSTLLPAANLTSYGYLRDIEKWAKRDKRSIKRDTLNLEEYNPYIAGHLLAGVNTINSLFESNPNAESYVHKKVVARASSLSRGLKLYNKAIAGAIGEMLSYSPSTQRCGEGRGKWLDVAGQYITRSYLESLLDDVESEKIASLEAIDLSLKAFAKEYQAYAYDWALGLLGQLLGHEPQQEEIEGAISAAEGARAELRKMALRDKEKDFTVDMKISYGIDAESDDERTTDFNAVRGV